MLRSMRSASRPEPICGPLPSRWVVQAGRFDAIARRRMRRFWGSKGIELGAGKTADFTRT
jgi:hypothetical protein